jgi:hypothetical protein
MTDSTVGRNEPCPCGSGKKYKRCCGVDAAPKLTAPAAGPAGLPGGLPPGMDQMDPAMMMQLSQAFQRLPRAQMQKFQSLMQRAMAGKDVSREAEELERSLPPEFKELMSSMAARTPDGGLPTQASGQASDIGADSGGGGDSGGGASSDGDMSVDDARRIVEEAVAAGKLSREQADALLQKR